MSTYDAAVVQDSDDATEPSTQTQTLSDPPRFADKPLSSHDIDAQIRWYFENVQ
jgi:hypothetical protein